METINQIKDNLWLGDIQEAKNIITTFLKEMEESTAELQRSFEEVSSLFKEVKERCSPYRKHKGLDLKYELCLSEEFKERIREPSKLKEAITGLLIFDLKKLLNILKMIEPFCKIIQKFSYRYTIFEYHPSKYEIRALIEREAKCNVENLVKKLEEEGFKLSKIIEKKYMHIAAFSTQGHIEISVLLPKVSIIIYLLTPSKEYVQELGEMIMNSLIS